ncbi:hypothetical protein [Candidatus Formimonas warabiya]|uniref:Uncharacterized protein n=1 Tax=Formimonas warabiya TaxID=1761012 RepID=A0A3G1KSX5_FORW1|nr:hypothetical protein [Candidatus Formimonas warabiya]ATW25275.1 hypothetical protein DCMF_11305 [Candidatus Formimonas warabiya]
MQRGDYFIHPDNFEIEMEDIMNIVKEIEVILEETKISGEYWEKGIPSSIMRMDIELNRVIENYANLSKEDKKLVGNDISTDIAWSLLYFAINMATYSLRFSEQRYFTNGLFALGMILRVLDQREILLVMPLFYDVSKKNKLSFQKILDQNNDFADFVNKFLSRREEDKTLECMGYILTKDENNNPLYKRTW